MVRNSGFGWGRAIKAAVLAAALLCFFASSPARADCATATIGAKPEGYRFYNADAKVMQYCDGTDWIAMNPPGSGGGGPTGCPSIGDLCSDGSYYIGQVGGNDIYATAAASESIQTWNNGTTNYTVTGFTSTTDGPGNTTGLAALSDAGAPYNAAAYCDGLANVHGHSDWYLPAKDELNLFWNGGSPVAGVSTSGSWYWSSTEDSSNWAWLQRFSDSFQVNANKDISTSPVRCVRRDSSGAGGCATTTAGTKPEGTIVYNADQHVMQVCSGNVWRPMGPVGGAAGLPDLTNGLVGWWKLDETTGTTAADSAGAANGTWSGEAAIRSATGKIGGAFDFDGIDDEVDLGNPADLQITGSMTVAAWVKFNSFTAGSADNDIFTKSDDTNGMAWQFKATEDCGPTTFALLLSWNGTGTDYTELCGATSLATGTWYHVAGVYDSAAQTMNIYVNGVLDNGAVQGNAVGASIFNSPFDAKIGQRSVPVAALDGMIDDVRVYNRALSASEIAVLSGQCADPDRPEGTMLYNNSSKVMQYCDGASWVAIGKDFPDPCAGSPSPGDVCADGSVYAGLSPDGNVPMYAQRCDAGMTWDGSNCTGTRTGLAWGSSGTARGTTSTTTGAANTATLAAFGQAAHPAAYECSSIGAGWYLPAQNELTVLYTNKSAGAFLGTYSLNNDIITGNYWTSTELNATGAQNRLMGIGGQGNNTGKANGLVVRCVKK